MTLNYWPTKFNHVNVSQRECVQNWKIWGAHTTNKKHNGSCHGYCWCKSITSLFLTFEMAVDNAISHLSQFQQVFCRFWSYHVITFKRCICMESFKRIHSACDTIKRYRMATEQPFRWCFFNWWSKSEPRNTYIYCSTLISILMSLCSLWLSACFCFCLSGLIFWNQSLWIQHCLDANCHS